MMVNETDLLVVPLLEPQQKHAAVFRKFDALAAGQGFLLINDHDPIPLYYEMKAERGELFDWEPVETGPELWKVLITKRERAAASINKENRTGDPAEFTIDVTVLPPREKHPAIFRHFDALKDGEAFRIRNDHDPKPLYYQMIAERGNVFDWQYLQRGPQWWEVVIRRHAAGASVGERAAQDPRKAAVFKKYGIDFCCGGKKSLQQACADAGVPVEEVEGALNAAATTEQKDIAHDYTRWQPDFLADYIYNQHHIYFYEEDGVIAELSEKVAARHGGHFPGLYQIRDLYKTLSGELSAHFIKEEKVLFPYIKALATAKRSGGFPSLQSLASVQQPVQAMESEHEAAGSILAEIRKAADDYRLPEGACNSFGLLYHKLQALEADLHMHIHLENNILFPKAVQLEKELAATS